MGGREARAEDLISFRPAAARELIEAVAYYEREREGRGQRFATAIEGALVLIAGLPQAHPILLAPDIRSIKVRRFRIASSPVLPTRSMSSLWLTRSDAWLLAPAPD
jgi:hypothetical protein